MICQWHFSEDSMFALQLPPKNSFLFIYLSSLCLKQKKNEKKQMEQFQAFHGKKIDVIIKTKHDDTSSGTASFLSI